MIVKPKTGIKLPNRSATGMSQRNDVNRLADAGGTKEGTDAKSKQARGSDKTPVGFRKGSKSLAVPVVHPLVDSKQDAVCRSQPE